MDDIKISSAANFDQYYVGHNLRYTYYCTLYKIDADLFKKKTNSNEVGIEFMKSVYMILYMYDYLSSVDYI